MRIEIRAKDEFWDRAFHIEWEDQFPGRKLKPVAQETYLAEAEWLADLERVATQCLCRVMQAPERPERRRWLRSLAGPIRPKRD